MSTLREKARELLRHAQLSKVSPNVIKAIVVIVVIVVVVAVARWAPLSSSQFSISANSGSAEVAAQDSGQLEDGDDTGSSGSKSADSGASGKTEAKALVVQVVGAVAVPGVYTLEEGQRVIDAINAAGGMSGDASQASVNLARQLQDGEQIYVPTIEEAQSGLTASPLAAGATYASGASASGSASASSGTAGGLININTATEEQLDQLPGVGPSTAKAIVDYRTQNGRFSSIEDIQEVSGIGESKYSKICGLICV